MRVGEVGGRERGHEAGLEALTQPLGDPGELRGEPVGR